MAIAGKNGKLVIGGEGVTSKVIGIKDWSLSLSIATLDDTELGNDWKKYILGLKEWTASSSGNYAVFETAGEGETNQEVLQDAYLNGTKLTVKLYVDATHYYTGQALITSLSIDDTVEDVVSISIEFTGCGALSFE